MKKLKSLEKFQKENPDTVLKNELFDIKGGGETEAGSYKTNNCTITYSGDYVNGGDMKFYNAKMVCDYDNKITATTGISDRVLSV